MSQHLGDLRCAGWVGGMDDNDADVESAVLECGLNSLTCREEDFI
jgi:hypothetical protein